MASGHGDLRLSNYGSPHRKNSATLFILTAAKQGYVKSVQGEEIRCRQCGRKLKEGEEIVAKWNGRYTQYYDKAHATQLQIIDSA